MRTSHGKMTSLLIRFGYTACIKNLLKSLFHFFFHYNFTDFNTEKGIDGRWKQKKYFFLSAEEGCIDKLWKRIEFHAFFLTSFVFYFYAKVFYFWSVFLLLGLVRASETPRYRHTPS